MNELKAYKQALHLALKTLAETELAPTEALLDLEQAVAFLEYKYNFTSENFCGSLSSEDF